MIKRINVISILLSVFLLVPNLIEGKTPAVCKKTNLVEVNRRVDATFKTLSSREKIAQLIMPMIIPSHGSETKINLDKWVGKEQVGGILVSKGTSSQYIDCVNKAQSLSKVPLLIAIDGEWGPAMRITDILSFPRNMALGAISDDRLIYEYGKEVARECLEYGITINFAPVLDVNTNPSNPVIGIRSFGESPELVARKGVAYSKGLEDGGVLSVAKHFPGHGSTSVDSHKSLPVINKSVGELELVDVLPFKRYIDAGLGGILVGHLDIPSFKEEGVPATYNKKVVTDFLSNKLNFKGLIFTDALGMGGASTSESTCVKALKAGNDVLLAPKDVTKEINAIEKAVEAGEISQKLIDEKCKKILTYKYILKVDNYTKVSKDRINNRAQNANTDALLNKLWKASITVFKNKSAILPLQYLKNIAVYQNSKTKYFYNACRLYTDVKEVSSIKEISNSDIQYILFPVINKDKETIELFKNVVATGKPVIAMFFINPYSVSSFSSSLNKDNVSAVLAYNDCSKAQVAAAEAIFGGIQVNGKLPVTILNVAKAGTGSSYAPCRLSYSTPTEAGVDEKIVAYVDSIVKRGLDTKAFPGCQVLMAKDGKVFINKAYGVTDADLKTPVTVNTMYDLASVSKAAGTLPGIMKAYDMGLINLDARISQYIPYLNKTNKRDITVKQLLFHESGIKPSLNMYDAMLDGSSYKSPLFKSAKDNTYSIPVSANLYGNSNAKLRSDILSNVKNEKYNIAIADGIYGNKTTYDSIMHLIYNSKLLSSKKYNYSCLNFCLLMNIEQNVTKRNHDTFVNEYIFEPLGAYHTMYRPLSKFGKESIAPTEYDGLLRHQKMHGYVHDELACFSGGVQGNAGLFSNSNDLAKLCQMWLNMGYYGGKQILSSNTVSLFTKTKSPTCRRGLGFDKPDKHNERNSPTCEAAPAEVYGHLGFTGTCFWVDPKNNIIFIFLCNRVNPTRDNNAFNKLNIRPNLFEAIYHNIKK